MSEQTDKSTAAKLVAGVWDEGDDEASALTALADKIAAALAAAREQGILSTFEQRAKDMDDLERRVRAEEREACADIVPTSWLDALMAGVKVPADGPMVERLLSRIAAAIRQRGAR